MSKLLGKIDKHIVTHLYFIGLSKTDIYNTLHRNGIKISKKTVYKYLSGKLKDKRGIYKNHSNYNRRVSSFYYRAVHRVALQKAGKKGMTWEEYHEQKEGLQDNFLKSAIISGLNKKLIHTGNKQLFIKRYGHLVKWNEYKREWESP